jgi:hypothetical protein
MPNADGGAIGLALRYLRAIERKADRLIDNHQDVKARLDRIERRLELRHRPADLRRKRN